MESGGHFKMNQNPFQDSLRVIICMEFMIIYYGVPFYDVNMTDRLDPRISDRHRTDMDPTHSHRIDI